jgi:hypothetical protein
MFYQELYCIIVLNWKQIIKTVQNLNRNCLCGKCFVCHRLDSVQDVITTFNIGHYEIELNWMKRNDTISS